MTLAYLAGGIDLVDDSLGWRALWAQDLKLIGIGSYSPAHAWTTDPAQTDLYERRRICEVNRAAILACELFLVNLDGGPVFGTLLELEMARINRREIAIVSRDGVPSYEAHDLAVYRSWRGLYKHLRGLGPGDEEPQDA